MVGEIPVSALWTVLRHRQSGLNSLGHSLSPLLLCSFFWGRLIAEGSLLEV